MSSLRLMCFSHKQVCEVVPRSLFWAFRISFHPDWQIDNGFFNRPIMARTQIPIHWCGGLDLSVAQVTVFVAACRKDHQVIPNGNY